MEITLGFDVYGTLIDTHGIIAVLEKFAGDKAAAFSRTWRDKQLEYSFRRGLRQNYANFAVCTGDAFDYTAALMNVRFSKSGKDEVIAAYRTLPAFDDVAEGLERARQSGYRMFAFSNGSADAVETLLKSAGIREYFIGVIYSRLACACAGDALAGVRTSNSSGSIATKFSVANQKLSM